MVQPNTILLTIPIIGLVGTLLSLIIQHRFFVRVRAIGEVTDEERKRLFIQSIVPSLFYGVACGLFLLLTNRRMGI
jgi:hypothetical protein